MPDLTPIEIDVIKELILEKLKLEARQRFQDKTLEQLYSLIKTTEKAEDEPKEETVKKKVRRKSKKKISSVRGRIE